MQPTAYMAMPAEFGAMQPGMHPEMLQGMPMQIVMGPMGPMIAGPMPHGMVPAGPMAAPQLTQMLVDAARGGRSSNVFFKTRICNKWRAGSCPYGDKCTYAHGEHELRYVPPEVVAQLEAQQKLQDPGQPRPGAGGEAHPRGEEGGGGSLPPFGGGSPGGGHQSFYKTRLCIKYMQTGYCHKASGCTFAHGYEDLRQPGAPLSPGRAQDPTSPTHLGVAMVGPGMAMMMPMQLPPGPMAAGGRGVPAPVPMPAHFPGGQQQHVARSPRGGGHGGGGRDDPAAAARRRASALCQIAGVGEVAQQEPHPGAMQAAMGEVRSGAAFRGSPYADSVADYVVQAQGGAPAAAAN